MIEFVEGAGFEVRIMPQVLRGEVFKAVSFDMEVGRWSRDLVGKGAA